MEKLIEFFQKPKLYEKSNCEFWNDEHISKMMLQAHLDPSWDAATRNHEFVQKSVDWISEAFEPKKYPKLLDLGCGPGIYADSFSKKGYKVTGVDFSKRSIEYAKANNAINNYLYMNYLEIDYENAFDIITLIYCDYAALSDDERKTLMNKIYKALKPGGYFIFDVFTPNNNPNDKEIKSWELYHDGGFWKEDCYCVFDAHYLYDNNISLNQHVIIDKDSDVSVIRIWNKSFTKETILHEIKPFSQTKLKIYSDVTGKEYTKDSKTLCIVLQK